MVPAMTDEAAVRREVVPMNILIVDDEQSTGANGRSLRGPEK